MLKLSAIFEKIKEDFFENQLDKKIMEQYKIVFAPFSTGFTNEDFLFLDSSSASDKALKYYDELYEFSQITNTIPSSDNFWTISSNTDDYLFNRYEKILKYLKLIDPDSLDVNMCYGHPVFDKALSKIDRNIKKDYDTYYNKYLKITKEIQSIKDSMDEFSKGFSEMQIELMVDDLKDIVEKWEIEGNRKVTEQEIMKIIISEIKRFVIDHSDIKSKIDNTKRTHIGSDAEFNITHCMPNNLYQSDELEWKKINIDKKELEEISNAEKVAQYEAILGNGGLAKLDIESISFELIFVNVTRPWFEDSLLKSSFWDIDMLDEAEINIPCYTDKLIFVRRIDIEVIQDSELNKKTHNKVVSKNLGPFIVNTALHESSGKLKIQAINEALEIDRKIVHNVAANIQEKEKKINTNAESIQKLISKKQHQFARVGARLKSMVENNSSEPPIEIAPLVFEASIQSAIPINNDSNLIQYEFNFKDDNQQVVNVLVGEINIFKDYQELDVTIETTTKGSILFSLQKHDVFSVVIEKDGFEKEEIIIDTNGMEGHIKTTQLLINVEPVEIETEVSVEVGKEEKVKIEKEPENDNTFQLIGVIAKKVQPFPKPIKKANYM